MACIHFKQLNRYCTNSVIPDSGPPTNWISLPLLAARLPAGGESHRFDAGNRAGPMSEKRQGRRQSLAHARRSRASRIDARCRLHVRDGVGRRSLLVKDRGHCRGASCC